MAITLEITTPTQKVYTETVDSVVIPSASGMVEILPGHIPLIGVLEMGEIIIKKAGHPETMMVDIGYFQVRGDTVAILTEGAVDVHTIDPEEVSKALERAENAREEAKNMPVIDEEEVDRLEAMVRFLNAQKQRKTGPFGS